MKTITTKKGEQILVDDDVYLWASQFDWRVTNERKYKYAVTGGRHKMHRIVMGTMRDSKLFVDHINGNGLDNRRENLRVCTVSENFMNQCLRTNNSSGYKGVHKLKAGGKYQSFCAVGGKRIYLGVFDTAEQAAIEYNRAAKRMHGEFARLNIIPQSCQTELF